MRNSPAQMFQQEVDGVNTCGHYYYKPPTVADVRSVDPQFACEFFNAMYSQPAAFTVVFVGKIDGATARPLFERYGTTLRYLYTYTPSIHTSTSYCY